MSLIVQCTFDDLDPVAPLHGIDEAGPNNPDFNITQTQIEVPSRAKAGRMVKIHLTKTQLNRKPLDVIQMSKITDIVRDIPSYSIGINKTKDALFSGPFTITLKKKDCFKQKIQKKKKRGPKSEKDLLNSKFSLYKTSKKKKKSHSEDDISNVSEKSSEDEMIPHIESDSESENSDKKPTTVDDLPETLLLMEEASRVQEDYWLPPLRESLDQIHQRGICPFFYVQKTIEISTYTKTNDFYSSSEDEEKDNSEKKKSEASESLESVENEYSDIEKYLDKEQKDGYKGKNINYSDSNLLSDEEFFDPNHKTSKEKKLEKKIKDKLRKGTLFYPHVNSNDNQTTDNGKYTNYTSNAADHIQDRESVDLSKKGGTTESQRQKMLGNPAGNRPKNALEALGVVIDMDYKDKDAPLSIPYSGLMSHETLGVAPSLTSRLVDMNENPLSESYGSIITTGASDVAHEVFAPNTYTGSEPTEKSDKISKKRQRREEKDTLSTKSTKRPKITEPKLKKAGPKKFQRMRNREVVKSKSRRPIIVRKITTVTHNVPIIPDSNSGFIEVYGDATGVRFMWTWKGTGDEYDGKIEPYMMFIVKNAPTSVGNLTAPLVTLIRDYVAYVDAMKQKAENIKARKNPFYVVTKPEIKMSFNQNGSLSSSNYVAMMNGQTIVPGNTPAIYQAGAMAYDANTNTTFPAKQMWQDPNHPQRLRPDGFLPEYGPGVTAGWNSGSLMDPTSREFRDTYRSVEMANTLNGRYGPPEAILRNQQERRREYEQRMRQHNARLMSDPEYIINSSLSSAEAGLTSSTLHRETHYSPLGTFMFMESGETVTEIKSAENINDPDTEAMRDRLDQMAAIIVGFPLNSVYQSKAQKGPDGSFTTKTSTTSSNACNYGLGVSHTMQSPAKDMVTECQSKLRGFYQEVIKQMFMHAYSNVFKSKEEYWQKLLENTFEANPTTNLSRRNAKGDSIEKGSLPSFQSFFEIEVTFPFSDNIGLTTALDLWKLGAFTTKDVVPYMIATSGGSSTIPYNLVNIISKQQKGSGFDYSEMVKRVEIALNEAKDFEKKKALKEPKEGSGGVGSKPKKKATKTGTSRK